MSEILKLIHAADGAAVELEKARSQVEILKQNLQLAKDAQESAQTAFDEILSGADALGVSRAKLRKLIDERTQSLVTSGLILDSSAEILNSGKPVRARKKSKSLSDENDTHPDPLMEPEYSEAAVMS